MIDSRMNYTLAEAARIIGVHRSTITRDCMAGALPYHTAQKAGTVKPKKYIKGTDLERYRLRIF